METKHDNWDTEAIDYIISDIWQSLYDINQRAPYFNGKYHDPDNPEEKVSNETLIVNIDGDRCNLAAYDQHIDKFVNSYSDRLDEYFNYHFYNSPPHVMERIIRMLLKELYLAGSGLDDLRDDIKTAIESTNGEINKSKLFNKATEAVTALSRTVKHMLFNILSNLGVSLSIASAKEVSDYYNAMEVFYKENQNDEDLEDDDEDENHSLDTVNNTINTNKIGKPVIACIEYYKYKTGEGVAITRGNAKNFASEYGYNADGSIKGIIDQWKEKYNDNNRIGICGSLITDNKRGSHLKLCIDYLRQSRSYPKALELAEFEFIDRFKADYSHHHSKEYTY